MRQVNNVLGSRTVALRRNTHRAFDVGRPGGSIGPLAVGWVLDLSSGNFSTGILFRIFWARPRGLGDANIEYFLPELRAHRAANMLATQIAPKRTRRVSRPKPCHRSSWQSGGSVMTRLRRARRVNSWPLSGADRTSSKPRRRPSLTRKGHHPDRDPAVQRPHSIHCWPRTC